MRTIQVNYDLHTPGRSYQPLYDYITSYPAYAHPLQSMWLVQTSKTVAQVRDELKRHIDANDEVLVFDVTGVAWASNFIDDHTKWMRNNMGILRAA